MLRAYRLCLLSNQRSISVVEEFRVMFYARVMKSRENLQSWFATGRSFHFRRFKLVIRTLCSLPTVLLLHNNNPDVQFVWEIEHGRADTRLYPCGVVNNVQLGTPTVRKARVQQHKRELFFFVSFCVARHSIKN